MTPLTPTFRRVRPNGLAELTHEQAEGRLEAGASPQSLDSAGTSCVYSTRVSFLTPSRLFVIVSALPSILKFHTSV